MDYQVMPELTPEEYVWRKAINLVRVGSNITLDMRDRTMITIPYND